MKTKPATHLRRVDPERNMARFYRLSMTPSLFGDTCVIREWDRIGSFGRIRIDLYEKPEDALGAKAAIAHAKRRRGYVEVIVDGAALYARPKS